MGTCAVFLDLNGTLVQPVLVDHPRQLTPVADGSSAVAKLCAAGFLCPVVTVQSRIEKGMFTEREFVEWFAGFAREMREEGAILLGPYLCPHRPRSRCACAKPATILHRRAAAEWGIDLAGSFTIGDTMPDVEAAWAFGGKGCLISPSAGTATATPPDYTASCLTDAVEWVLATAATGA